MSIQTYLSNPGFKSWISTNKFHLFTDDNIHRYYSIYQHLVRCHQKKCAECSGEVVTISKEEDITNDSVKYRKCFVPYEAARKEMADTLSKSVIIPPHYRDLTWENTTRLSKAIKDNIANFVKDFPNPKQPCGLYLYSLEKRAGKTTILWLILKDLLRDKKIFRGYIVQSTPMFMSDLRKEEFSKDGESDLFEKALTCDILMLDDFGKEKHTPQLQARLFSVIEERLVHNRPTIYASNIPPDPFIWSTPFEQDLITRINESTVNLNLDTEI